MRIIPKTICLVSQVPPHQTVQHSASVVFFTPGVYSLVMTCSRIPDLSDDLSPHDDKVTASSASVTLHRPNSIEAKKDLAKDTTNPRSWVYKSPVRFEVTWSLFLPTSHNQVNISETSLKVSDLGHKLVRLAPNGRNPPGLFQIRLKSNLKSPGGFVPIRGQSVRLQTQICHHC